MSTVKGPSLREKLSFIDSEVSRIHSEFFRHIDDSPTEQPYPRTTRHPKKTSEVHLSRDFTSKTTLEPSAGHSDGEKIQKKTAQTNPVHNGYTREEIAETFQKVLIKQIRHIQSRMPKTDRTCRIIDCRSKVDEFEEKMYELLVKEKMDSEAKVLRFVAEVCRRIRQAVDELALAKVGLHDKVVAQLSRVSSLKKVEDVTVSTGDFPGQKLMPAKVKISDGVSYVKQKNNAQTSSENLAKTENYCAQDKENIASRKSKVILTTKNNLKQPKNVEIENAICSDDVGLLETQSRIKAANVEASSVKHDKHVADLSRKSVRKNLNKVSKGNEDIEHDCKCDAKVQDVKDSTKLTKNQKSFLNNEYLIKKDDSSNIRNSRDDILRIHNRIDEIFSSMDQLLKDFSNGMSPEDKTGQKKLSRNHANFQINPDNISLDKHFPVYNLVQKLLSSMRDACILTREWIDALDKKSKIEVKKKTKVLDGAMEKGADNRSRSLEHGLTKENVKLASTVNKNSDDILFVLRRSKVKEPSVDKAGEAQTKNGDNSRARIESVSSTETKPNTQKKNRDVKQNQNNKKMLDTKEKSNQDRKSDLPLHSIPSKVQNDEKPKLDRRSNSFEIKPVSKSLPNVESISSPQRVISRNAQAKKEYQVRPISKPKDLNLNENAKVATDTETPRSRSSSPLSPSGSRLSRGTRQRSRKSECSDSSPGRRPTPTRKNINQLRQNCRRASAMLQKNARCVAELDDELQRIESEAEQQRQVRHCKLEEKSHKQGLIEFHDIGIKQMNKNNRGTAMVLKRARLQREVQMIDEDLADLEDALSGLETEARVKREQRLIAVDDGDKYTERYNNLKEELEQAVEEDEMVDSVNDDGMSDRWNYKGRVVKPNLSDVNEVSNRQVMAQLNAGNHQGKLVENVWNTLKEGITIKNISNNLTRGIQRKACLNAEQNTKRLPLKATLKASYTSPIRDITSPSTCISSRSSLSNPTLATLNTAQSKAEKQGLNTKPRLSMRAREKTQTLHRVTSSPPGSIRTDNQPPDKRITRSSSVTDSTREKLNRKVRLAPKSGLLAKSWSPNSKERVNDYLSRDCETSLESIDETLPEIKLSSSLRRKIESRVTEIRRKTATLQ